MNASDRCIAFLKQHEAFKSHLYNDAKGGGHCTIGYGYLVHYGPIDGRELEKQFENGVSEEWATEHLKFKVKEAENAVNQTIDVPMKQSEFDAFVSFAYNVGCGAFRGSTLAKKFNAGDIGEITFTADGKVDHATGVYFEFMRWTHSCGQICEGLVNRRVAEIQLFQEC